MFITDPHGQTRFRPSAARLAMMSDVVRYHSDVPAIPPAYIASPVSLPRPPWAEPVNA
jgi:hypothetical protein